MIVEVVQLIWADSAFGFAESAPLVFPKVFAVTYSSKRVHHLFPLFLQTFSGDSWARQCNKVEFGILLQLPFVAVYQFGNADGLTQRTPAVLTIFTMRATFRVYNQGLGASEGVQIRMKEFGTWGEVGKVHGQPIRKVLLASLF